MITGDKVTVSRGPGHAVSVDGVQRPSGAAGSVRVAMEGGDTYVYPDEAMAYIATGRLDRQLFDVTQLVAQGYDDVHTNALPLIMTRAQGTAMAKTGAGAELPGAEPILQLPAIRGQAVHARRAQAAAFWSALTGVTGQDAERSTAPSADSAPAFAAGVGTVWLDGKAHATLADTTAQIGVPQAWSAGGTGSGVRVAVLDSGVDTAHPDLAPRIVDTRSFIPGEDVIDHNGHGTHTASTVAGTGAASGGKERGVAPGADLLIGKVLDNSGSGAMSQIIAGMEWAARTEHARVINMSLGTPVWHTQDDPLSQAVNQLSAETGALFVIAAGNSGNSPYSVSSPGTADAALTVGAVDASDQLAGFSSTGPRLNDDGLKPDITAPGVDVLAARSQYSQGGEGYYRTDSGTSMAAPHVAGAAVLLAQKHPQWSGQEIKDALMSTSAPTPAYSPYQAGAGRVDVAAAYLHDQVIADGSVDAGLVRWSANQQHKPVERHLTYRNTTDHALTLALSVDPGTTPAGVFTPAASHVTVPAHGTSTVGLVANPKGLAPGQYGAQVVARSATGVVHTAVGMSVESEKYDLTVHLKDRHGKPVDNDVEITGADGRTTIMWVPDGKLTARLAPGSYTIVSTLDVEGRHGPHSLGYAVLTAPELDLTGDRDVVLDASRIRPIKVDTPEPTSVTTSRIDLFRSFTSTTPSPSDGQALHEILMPSAAYDSLWALPTKGRVTKGSFVFTSRIRAEQTPLKITYRGDHSLDDTLLVQPGSHPFPDGATHVDAVYAGTGTAADYAGLNARGKAVVVRHGTEVAATDQAAAAHAAGAAMLLVVNDGDGRGLDWYGDPDGRTAGQLPVTSLTTDDGEALIRSIKDAGRSRLKLVVRAHPSPTYLYDLADYHQGGVPDDPSAKTDPGSLARIDNTFAPPAGKQVMESREDSPPYEYWPAAYPYAGFGMTRVPPFPREPVAAGHRTDWVSAGNGVKWQQYAAVDGWSTFTDVVGYRPGSTHEERWFGPVVRPRMVGFEVPHRVGNAMGGTLAAFGDGGSAHSGDSNLMTRSFALYQGDTLLVRNGARPDFGVGDLPSETLPYRLVADTRTNSDLLPYSRTTHTEWTFRSGTADDQALPLVQLDYGTDVDLAGRAKRTSMFSVQPVVLGSTAADDTVSSVRLEVSYDDGATWRQQNLKQDKGSWQTRLHAPSGAGYVSLRVSVQQRNGGGVTQTVTRAFGLH
ncbi:hypothetical protein AQJ23_39570 [Streptomyces antibioticus]|nr:hypothetical protein AQJ23_39570 [Streptomyces antibioticus]